jgi:UDPglucose 6-dehydrogenase
MSQIAVIGTGYVGLVTGACFSDLGNNVRCVDISRERIEQLNQGNMPIFEPGLEEIVERSHRAGRLTFTTNYEEALKDVEFVFIAVGTPSGDDGEADMRYVRSAVEKIAEVIDHSIIIVDKSTVPVGTGDWIESMLSSHQNGRSFDCKVVSNPEFLREGSAINDFMRPDRIVLGSKHKDASEKVAELYSPLKSTVLITDIRSAEMIKYASNAFLATKISFINEIANICDSVGANVIDVAKGMGLDTRIGPKFLNAGIGWGGSCFPKDVKALAHIASEHGTHPQLLQAVIDINRAQRTIAVEKIAEMLRGLEDRHVGVLGLAFKPNTDDMRESPAAEIIQQLIDRGAKIRAYDPEAMNQARAVIPDEVVLCTDAYLVAEDADALLLATEWNEFTQLDFRKIHSLMRGDFLLDGRNLWDGEHLKSLGFRYAGIGLGNL